MTILASEPYWLEPTQQQPHRFEAKLLERRDTRGNLGLNAVLSYKYLENGSWRKKPIHLQVEPHIDWQGHLPYAFQFLPPMRRSPHYPNARDFPIIRIVAAPGANILLPASHWPRKEWQLYSLANPKVEIIRVQDVALVPPLGRDILTHQYVYTAWHDPDPTRASRILSEDRVRVEARADGVDIVQERFHRRLVVRVRGFGKNSGLDRFLYKFERRSGRNVLVLMVTGSVWVELQDPATPFAAITPYGGDPFRGNERRLEIEYLRLPNLFAFNVLAEYFHLEGFPRTPASMVAGSAPIPPHRRSRQPEDAVSFAVLDSGIGMIPIVGDLYDLAQFVYGISSGKDLHGARISNMEIAITGLCVLLPIATAGMFRGAVRRRELAQTFGQKARMAEELASGLKLGAEEKKLLSQGLERAAKGERLPKQLIEEIHRVVEKPPPKLHVLDDFLDASKSGFTHPTLQKKYREFVAAGKKANKPILSPEQWARKQTRGEVSELLESLLGKDFRATRKQASEGKFDSINASEIIRPDSLNGARLEQFLRMVLKEGEVLLRKVPADKIVDGRISKNMFSEIQGAVGEILARRHKDAILAASRAEFGEGMELFEGVRIVVKKTDTGEWTNKSKEFTDGIVAGINRDGDLVINDVIEIKAGDRVAQEVQGQIHRWIEDRITDGARILLPDGRLFEYFPSDPNVKRVIGLARAKRHIINPQGKSHLGMNSGDQVAAQIQRSELPASDKEIKFITALVQNTQAPRLLNETSAEIDFLVRQLAEMISRAN